MKVQRTTPVTIWLAVGIVMVMIQILLGGVTRLTGSGLSITEWKPLLGALPPLTKQAWQESFEKYQQIAQFKRLNSHFSLSDYQAIFFWEWLHREWARLMGLVFLIPFVFFLLRKQICRKWVMPFGILLLLGALQGLIGWLMVQSGLNDTDTRVSHIRLAVHFLCALVLLVYLLWLMLKIRFSHFRKVEVARLHRFELFLLLVLFLQMMYGAFMAGSHAALFAPTWPDLNGAYFPMGMQDDGGWRSLVNDPIIIQLIHRNLAYLIVLLIAVWYYRTGKLDVNSCVYRFRFLPPLLVCLQVILGVLALTNSMFKSAIYFSLAHQLLGMSLLMTMFVLHFFNRLTVHVNV